MLSSCSCVNCLCINCSEWFPQSFFLLLIYTSPTVQKFIVHFLDQVMQKFGEQLYLSVCLSVCVYVSVCVCVREATLSVCRSVCLCVCARVCVRVVLKFCVIVLVPASFANYKWKVCIEKKHRDSSPCSALHQTSTRRQYLGHFVCGVNYVVSSFPVSVHVLCRPMSFCACLVW